MGKPIVENACLRRVVVLYNAFFWITGPGMIGMGIWLLIVLDDYNPVLDREEFAVPAYIVTSAGGASVLAGLLGCLGGLNQNRRLLVLYSVLLVLVCAMEVTATVLCFLTYDKADAKLGVMLNNTVQEYSKKDISQVMDSIHKEYSCCGANSYSDWLTAPFYTSVIAPSSLSRQVAPYSCCVIRHNNTGCNLGNADGSLSHPNLLYQTGCKEALVDWLQHIYVIAGWSSSGVAATLVLALSAVCCLKHALSDLYS
ncbi:CD151 antigen-like [Littorina saxatilis]|uniref:CD151 antigen-like n=1 Tax=Littorina saxatilis TaxID=31220 RepID=UPI0038B4B0E0